MYPEENDDMIGDVSSALYNTSYALGEFVGPLLGGVLSEYTSFPRASSLFGIMMLLFSILYYKSGFDKEL
jgi:predicted MFS family arabinose efflux permease